MRDQHSQCSPQSEAPGTPAPQVPGGVERLQLVTAQVQTVGADVAGVLTEGVSALQGVSSHLGLAQLPELAVCKLHLAGREGQ